MDVDAFKHYVVNMALIGHGLKAGLATHDQIIAGRCTKVKRRYRTCQGKEPTTYCLKAFVKGEKRSDNDKPPRLIQAYAPVVNYKYAQYYKEVEEKLLTTKLNGIRCVAKGLNSKQRAQLLVQSWNILRKPVCYALDHSKYDSRINWLLKYVQLVTQFLGHTHMDEAIEYAMNFLHSKGITSGGIYYEQTGRRTSGSLDTGGGNTMINLAMILTVLEREGYRFNIKDGEITSDDDVFVMVDGDDAYILVDGRELDLNFSVFGMQTVVEKITNIFEIEFCQSTLWYLQDGPVMIRTLERQLNRLFHSSAGSVPRDYYQQVAEGERRVNNGVPVVTEVALANLGPFRYRPAFDTYLQSRDYKCRPKQQLNATVNRRGNEPVIRGPLKWKPRCPCSGRIVGAPYREPVVLMW